MRRWGIQHRVLTLAGGLALASSMASGYYQWTFFTSHNGPFVPIQAKFELNQLPGAAIPYFISDQAPGPLMPGDSFNALVSQIQAAANVWNGVGTSLARLSFGGLSSGAPQSSPGVDVVFSDDMPPGLLAQTYPAIQGNFSSFGAGTSSIPILRSRIQLRRDLTNPAQPSSSDAFFTTVVHEFGHALGLQHSLTSGVMSTITRAVTKASPLAADDIAGISQLYPAPGYLQTTGTIAGTVLLNGSGVNLASVVALSANGTAISALTNPDGTYRIAGVPPGQYSVYAQPLPPPLQGEAYPNNIIPPEDLQRNPFPANTSIDTEFFVSPGTGTHDWTQAAPVFVSATGVAGGVNFNMQRRTSQTIPWVETLAYYGANDQIPVYSPPLVAGSRGYLVFYAPGTTSGTKLAAGLGVSAIGAGAPARTEANTLQYWAGSNGYGLVVTDANPVTAPTAVALAVTLPNELYVLPAAFFVVPGGAPAISGVSGVLDGQGNTTVNVAGTNLNASTRVVFDGSPGTVTAANSDGSLTVTPPAAAANYTAAVEALSADGQTSSQQLGAAAPPAFTYAGPLSPAITVNYGVLAPGADSEVDIIGFNTAFDSQAAVGFGSSDIVIRRMWVLNPGRILLNVTVLPTAQPGPVELTVSSGLQVLTQNTLLQVQVPSARQMDLHVPILNQATGLAGVPSPGLAVISTTGLPQNLTTWTLTVDGVKAGFSMVGGNQVFVQVPAGLPVGAAVVALTSPAGDQIPQVVMQIDGPPPVVVSAANSAGVTLDSTHAVRVGDTITLTVSGLFDGSTPASAPITVLVGGVDLMPAGLQPASQAAGWYQVQVPLAAGVPFGPNEAVQVGIGTRLSNPLYVAILPQ